MKEYGELFVVATPIGNLEDMTQRAITVLSDVDLIAAEDTRHSRPFLKHFNIETPTISLHAHNEREQTDVLLSRLKLGEKIALISDAGTPLISDPGQNLVAKSHNEGIKVTPIPGCSALIAALSASGFPGNQFLFEGFLPIKSGARRGCLKTLKSEKRTWVLYESPHRILDLLEDMEAVLGGERYILIGRELTKLFETIKREKLSTLRSWILEDKNRQKGEFVIVVEGENSDQEKALSAESKKVLEVLLEAVSVSQAVKLAAKITGESRNLLYEFATKEKE